MLILNDPTSKNRIFHIVYFFERQIPPIPFRMSPEPYLFVAMLFTQLYTLFLAIGRCSPVIQIRMQSSHRLSKKKRILLP